MLHGRLWLREEHMDVSKPGIMRIRGKNTLIPTGKAQKRRAFPPKKICKISKVKEGQQEMLKLRKNLEIAGEKSI
jgi:hypothetical protein